MHSLPLPLLSNFTPGRLCQGIVTAALICVAGSVSGAVLEDWLENKNEARLHIDGGRIAHLTSGVREGNNAFLLEVRNSSERRAEMEAWERVGIGTTNWYGWSLKIDSNLPNYASGIIAQFATYPTNKNFWVNGASGNGSHIIVGRHGGGHIYGSDNRVTFVLQHQGDSDGIKVTTFDLGHVSEFKGRWNDFVIQVKWTGNGDGFLKLWRKRSSSSTWGSPRINHSGTTFWNDEGVAPYFKWGIYAADHSGQNNSRVRVYYDSYRHGDSNSYLNQVRPRPLTK